MITSHIVLIFKTIQLTACILDFLAFLPLHKILAVELQSSLWMKYSLLFEIASLTSFEFRETNSIVVRMFWLFMFYTEEMRHVLRHC